MKNLILLILVFYFSNCWSQNNSTKLYLESCRTLELIKYQKDSLLLEVYRNSTGPKYATIDWMNTVIESVSPWLIANDIPPIDEVIFSKSRHYKPKNVELKRFEGVTTLKITLKFFFSYKKTKNEIEFIYSKFWPDSELEPPFKLRTINYIENKP